MDQLPIISGHRGSKGTYAENTLIGFEKCFGTGATNFETDIHLTADKVCVISHDVNTKRVYVLPNGEEADFIIPQTEYDVLKDLVNKETGTKFLTFKDVLNLFKKHDDVSETKLSIMLDIKGSNKPIVMQYIVRELLEVHNDINYWLQRIQFGVWAFNFVKYMNQDDYFQQLYDTYDIQYPFNIYNIAGSWKVAISNVSYNHYLDDVYGKERHLFKFTGISILYLSTWSYEFLEKFMPYVKAEGLNLFTWTVNNTLQYDYFNKLCMMSKIPEYGIISDFPEKMQKHKESTSYENLPKKLKLTLGQKVGNFFFNFLVRFVKLPEPNFKAPVDPEFFQVRQVSYIARTIFQVCQYFGIF